MQDAPADELPGGARAAHLAEPVPPSGGTVLARLEDLAALAATRPALVTVGGATAGGEVVDRGALVREVRVRAGALGSSEPPGRLVVVPAGQPGSFVLDVLAATIVGTAVPGAVDVPERVRDDVLPAGEQPDALVVPTSGTTGRAKWVRLTHANLLASAAVAAGHHGLGPDDRVLPLSPLTHVMGLRAVLDALLVGATVVLSGAGAPAELDAAVDALVEGEPTVLIGPPALLRGLAAAVQRRHVTVPEGLRFVRSGSAHLTGPDRARLAAVFGVPVVAGYGMTEAAKIASHPVPAVARKEATVGVPTTELRVVDGDGGEVTPGEEGVIEVRGALVTPGYRGDPEANRGAFHDGWFVTGDRGTLDGDGFLTLAGRADDLINRGGEMVSPRAVESAVLGHPDVEQCVVVGLDHPSLGAEVGALVVVRDGAAVPSVPELASWVAAVSTDATGVRPPDVVHGVDRLPLAASGKPSPAVAADVLTHEMARRAEQAAAEAGPGDRSTGGTVDDLDLVAGVWRDLLDPARPLGPGSEFVALGGNSLLAIELSLRLGELVGVGLPLSLAVEHRTLGEQAALVAQLRAGGRGRVPSIVRFPAPRPLPVAGPTVVLVPGTDGITLSLERLARHLSSSYRVVGLDAPRAGDEPVVEIDDLAEHHVGVLAAEGMTDLHLVGYSFGGLLALEVARRLEEAGRPARSVVLVDTMAPEARHGYEEFPDRWTRLALRLTGAQRRWIGVRAGWEGWRLGRDLPDRWARCVAGLRSVPGGWGLGGGRRTPEAPDVLERLAVGRARRAAARAYEPPSELATPVVLVVSSVRARQCADPMLGWQHRLRRFDVERVRASHASLLTFRSGALARRLARRFGG